MPAYAINALVPGSALLTRARLAVALPLVVAALACASLAALAVLASVPGIDGLAVHALLGYAALGVVATVALWHHDRAGRIDPARVRALHREAAAAYLRSDLVAAERSAGLLIRAAPREPGAWNLMALVAQARGNAPGARRAARRARALESEAS
ncbi:MAG: hypothetical protein H0V44_17980 [Planctomycetes bacterium]|nr:hypothetical protein [Planctomycetota bacterium]